MNPLATGGTSLPIGIRNTPSEAPIQRATPKSSNTAKAFSHCYKPVPLHLHACTCIRPIKNV